jgi:hypothetical protein
MDQDKGAGTVPAEDENANSGPGDQAGGTATGGDRDAAGDAGDQGGDAGDGAGESLEDVKAERDKAKRQAARRDTALRAAQEKIAKLEAAAKGDGDKAKEPSPLEKANAKLLQAAARTVLASAGVTDRDQQRAVIDVLQLSGVEVGDNGDVDEDALSDIVDVLKKAFGGGQRRSTPRVSPVDKGSQSGAPTVDRDTARYYRIMGRRP